MVSARTFKPRTRTYSLEVPSVKSGSHQPLVAFILILPELFDVDKINDGYEIDGSMTSYVNEIFCSDIPILTTKK